jgi:muramoyltetrapeptide carboxypeptidase
MSVWRPLERDEPIGVVALSGPVDPEKLAAGLDVLRSWGHPVETAPNLLARQGYLAGSDDDRVGGLEELLERGVRTFIASRGGFGITRLLDRLPWQRLVADEVRFIGFSDLTAMLNPLAPSVVQVHGPMAAAGLTRPANEARLRDLLGGRLVGRNLFDVPPASVLRHGRAVGRTVGGNLSVVAALVGTRWEPDFNDAVLVLEEVSEPPYRLDRLLTQIRGSASFGGVKALICGTLHACRPHAECTARWSDLLFEATAAGTPVVFGLPFGHGARNMAFPVGATVEVDTRRGAVSWSV